MNTAKQNTPSTEVSKITSISIHPALQKLLEEKFLTQTTTSPSSPSAPAQTNTTEPPPAGSRGFGLAAEAA